MNPTDDLSKQGSYSLEKMEEEDFTVQVEMAASFFLKIVMEQGMFGSGHSTSCKNLEGNP